MGEARGTPSYVSPVAMQSPRYGGCVSAFFNLFDWTSAKRFSSSKRLRASSEYILLHEYVFFFFELAAGFTWNILMVSFFIGS